MKSPRPSVLRRIHFPEEIQAETEVRIPLFFDAPIEETDKTILRCHLYDEIFNIDHYLPDISIGSLEVPKLEEGLLRWMPIDTTYLPHVRIAKLKFPEELAGGTFRIEFLIQSSPDDLAANCTPYEIAMEKRDEPVRMYFKKKMIADIDQLLKRSLSDSSPMPRTQTFPFQCYDVKRNYFQSNIKVTSSDSQAPKIMSVCWGVDEEISFGKPSKQRTETQVGKNETLFLHIQTHGLYGHVIPTLIGNVRIEVRIKDNTAVCVGALWFWISRGITSFFNATDKRIECYAGLYPQNKDGSLDTTKVVTKSIVYATPQLTYVPNRISPISPSTTAVAVSAGGQIKPEIYGEAHCMVEFRPTPEYQGDFGFSWFRKGDLQSRYGVYSQESERLEKKIDTLNRPSNDHDFAEIMGHHYASETVGGQMVEYIVQDGNSSSTHSLFKKDTQMYHNHSLDYYRILMKNMDEQKYHIPYMTIRKDVEAELSLHISVREKPEKLIYRFDNPAALSEGYMTINGAAAPYEDISPPSETGETPDMTKTIKIKCLKEFSKPLWFEVYAKAKDSEDEHLCGAVYIFPNDLLHQRKINVVFFNVKTKINGGKPRSGIAKDDTSKSDILKKYLGQAYVIPEITTVELDLVDETTKVTDADYLACCIQDTTVQGAYTSIDPDKKNDLKKFLLQATEEKYDNCFKIFFIGDRCPGSNGFSLGEKFTVCFSSAIPSTPAHELGHALGLPHTFDGSTSRAKYIYEDGMTDNIMDYSHLLGIARHSFFHWQWHTMNIKLR
ncbi:zinc-dependent metalloprotease [Porphyromonas endodontalis]|uniref:zinc-dependent metalloprotease n=1 Tax=Porphyromonas endodontalis TaxID=28124 RepID=UPI0005906F51|nr:zinc-dependent metalloprotease [Porphyromonas endodontalis]UBH63944.1 zinc-dependent metalloprotease [Porphyromonas endodontalis]